MKTTMKLFAAITIMLGFTLTSFGQANIMTSKAAIVDAIEVTVANTLDYGNILSPTGLVALDKRVGLDAANTLSGSATTVAGGTPPQHGIFKIVKGANTSVSVQYTTFADELVGPSGSAPMELSAKTSNCNTSPTDGTTGTSVNPSTTATATSITGYNSSTAIYVHVTATLTAEVAQMAGVYNGDITLTATYN